MRVLLCFKGDVEVTRLIIMPVLPRNGEFLETGTET
jgi:hypothetical protein